MRASIRMVAVSAFLVVAWTMVGCDKKEADSSSAKGTRESSASQPATAAQTMCPVSGHKIDTKVSTEYQGKTVYFCCSDCIEAFKKDPSKYTAKLPQFGGKEEPSKKEGS